MVLTVTPFRVYDSNCNDPGTTKQPFLMWARDANDPPIIEGGRFSDVTTGCGSVHGMTRDMSYFLAGVRVTQPITTLVRQKLDGLRLVVERSGCISSQVARRLGQTLDRATETSPEAATPT